MAVTASPEQQQALLDLQGLDTKLLQLAHKRSGLPEIAAAQDEHDKLIADLPTLDFGNDLGGFVGVLNCGREFR